MDIKQFIQRYPFYKFVNRRFAMCKLSDMSIKKQAIVFSELHSLLFVLKGSAEIRIGERPMTLNCECFIDLIGREPVTILKTSEDALCYHLIFSESLIDELFKNKPPFPLSYIMEHQCKPIPLLEIQFVPVILNRLELLDELVSDKEHLFCDERIISGMMLLYLDMANIYILQESGQPLPSDSDRKRELFIRFAKLSSKDVTDNHTVAYYAEQLCITPQYLARIVKEFTQMTVHQLLQKNITGECIKLLCDTNKTVLQISEELHFADQSTFTKYFKRSTGYSPSEYRQKMK